MEILFIEISRRIFTPYSGASVRTKLFVKALSEIAHVDVISLAIDDEVSDISNCDVVFSKKILNPINRLGGIRSIICATLWPDNPYSYFQLDKKKEAIIDSFVKGKKYDFIACHFIDSAIKCGLLKYKDRLIIDADDNLVDFLKIQVVQARFITEKWKKQYLLNRVGRMLNKLFCNIRCSFCSNKFEILFSNTILLPNTAIVKKLSSWDYVPNCILFIGNLSYYPNSHGINHFVKEVFPIIRHAITDVKLCIVGEGKKDFIDYLNSIDGVNAIGRVDDILQEYQNASVVVIPIYYGAGSSVKFVEALLMNRPVVSSPVGARGFSEICQDGVHYMLANDDEEFANKTIELLSSVSKQKEMAKNGFFIASQHFSQERFIEIVKESILNCMKS